LVVPEGLPAATIDEQVVDDRRGFVDWFVKVDGEWRIQAAVDLP
jgi:hypothetical protein